MNIEAAKQGLTKIACKKSYIYTYPKKVHVPVQLVCNYGEYFEMLEDKVRGGS